MNHFYDSIISPRIGDVWIIIWRAQNSVLGFEKFFHLLSVSFTYILYAISSFDKIVFFGSTFFYNYNQIIEMINSLS